MNGSNDAPPRMKVPHIDSNLDMIEAAVRSMLTFVRAAP